MSIKSDEFAVVYLSQGAIALIDADDQDRVFDHNWSVVNHKGKLYASFKRRGQPMVYLHRFIMREPDEWVAFVNGFSLDCRKANLRRCAKPEFDLINRSRPGMTSRYRGVHLKDPHKRKKPWVAVIEHAGRKIQLGTFANEDDAARAYDLEAIKLKGVAAKLNFNQEPANA